MADAPQIAACILAGFDRHYALFRQITASAQQRFERADWTAAQRASRERIEHYDQRVAETVAALRSELSQASLDEPFWKQVKIAYVGLLHEHCQPELAESFYNSVFCRLFHRRYYNNRNIFVRPAVSTEHMDLERPAHRCRYPGRDGFRRVVSELLTGFGFALPFEDLRRDLSNVLRTVREHFHAPDSRRQNLQLQVLNAPFFRNKGAYLVGKLINGPHETPYPEFELSDEPWYRVGPNDLFPEEWLTFLFPDPETRRMFLNEHGDLMEPEFWIQQQARIRTGRVEDVFPYPSAYRFPRQRRQRLRLDPAAPQNRRRPSAPLSSIRDGAVPSLVDGPTSAARSASLQLARRKGVAGTRSILRIRRYRFGPQELCDARTRDPSASPSSRRGVVHGDRHTLADRDRDDHKRSHDQRLRVDGLMQQPGRGGDGDKRLEQLGLPDPGDAAKGQARVTEEEADQLADQRQIEEHQPDLGRDRRRSTQVQRRRPLSGPDRRPNGGRHQHQGQAEHQRPADHLPAAQRLRQLAAHGIADRGHDQGPEQRQIAGVNLTQPLRGRVANHQRRPQQGHQPKPGRWSFVGDDATRQRRSQWQNPQRHAAV
jgi:hypothetical protein